MLSDEEKNRIIEELKLQKAYAYKFNNPQIKMITGCALNLIEKQSKEIEGLKEDNKKKSIVIIEYQDLYEKLEDKIKAKINELEEKRILARNSTIGIQIYDEIREQIRLLYSLLEKE